MKCSRPQPGAGSSEVNRHENHATHWALEPTDWHVFGSASAQMLGCDQAPDQHLSLFLVIQATCGWQAVLKCRISRRMQNGSSEGAMILSLKSDSSSNSLLMS